MNFFLYKIVYVFYLLLVYVLFLFVQYFDFYEEATIDNIIFFASGCNNETCPPSKCGAFHGCGYKTSSSIYSDRVFA